MPAYNADKYIEEAIKSVINQTYENWELLVINDGSKDNTELKIKLFHDYRIKYFIKENKGVSSARNIGVANMQGDYFCFLDADDILPKNSLNSRLKAFESSSEIDIVDGSVSKFISTIENVIAQWSPSMKGNPLKDLVTLGGNSFFGPTWMIKRDSILNPVYFNEEITHGEDMLFFIECVGRYKLKYAYTNDIILHYRLHDSSAMTNLDMLDKGYKMIYQCLKSYEFVRGKWLFIYLLKFKKIIFLSFLNVKLFKKAFKTLIQ